MRYDVILSNEVQNTPLLTAKNSRTLTSPGRAPRARAASKIGSKEGDIVS